MGNCNIIIDGYNVIGILHRDIQKAREDFIDLLIKYKKIKDHEIVVVFDGHKSGSANEEKIVRGGIKIIYSRLNDRADDVIKRILSTNRREWLVISSDRDIARYAFSLNSIPISSERFYEIILRRVKSNDLNIEGKEISEVFMHKDISDEDNHIKNHRGNPRQLSKKEKALKRAIAKL